jgi:hypothetical protein
MLFDFPSFEPEIWRYYAQDKAYVPNIFACPMFRNLAVSVWFTLRESQKLRTSVGEESITDLLLLYLARYCRSQITVHKFSRNQEKLHGADWEWWIKIGGLWTGMRVQAKRIDVVRQEYLQLSHKVKRKNGRWALQVNNLIAEAKMPNSSEPHRIPIYCFYNCFGMQDDPNPDDLEFGCAIASAPKVRNLITAKPARRCRDDIKPISFPWHYLVCKWNSHDDIKKALVHPSARGDYEPVPIDRLPPHAQALARDGKRALDAMEEAPSSLGNTDLAGVVLIDKDRS